MLSCTDTQLADLVFNSDTLPFMAKTTKSITINAAQNAINLDTANIDYKATEGITINGTFSANKYLTLQSGSIPPFDDNRQCKKLCQPIFPSVFTPNGDGINDEFMVTAAFATKYHILVYQMDGSGAYKKLSEKTEMVYSNAPFSVYKGENAVNYGILSCFTVFYSIDFWDCPGNKYTFKKAVALCL